MLMLALLIGSSEALQAQTAAATQITYICSCGACPEVIAATPGNCPKCGMKLVEKSKVYNVAIFLYEGVEILDFGGPSEVFAAAGRYAPDGGTRVFTVAATKEPITSQGFIKVIPEYTIADCPRPDIIVLPGGDQRQSAKDPAVIDWIRTNTSDDQVAISVCTGAFLLHAAGRLDGKKATTWHGATESLRQKATKTEVLENVRWVDNGNIITTAGVSAGIDGALHLVERLFGAEAAQKTARYMEYDKWKPAEGVSVVAEQNGQ